MTRAAGELLAVLAGALLVLLALELAVAALIVAGLS